MNHLVLALSARGLDAGASYLPAQLLPASTLGTIAGMEQAALASIILDWKIEDIMDEEFLAERVSFWNPLTS